MERNRIRKDGEVDDAGAAIDWLAEARGPAGRFVAHGEAGRGSDASAGGLRYRDDVVAEAGEAGIAAQAAYEFFKAEIEKAAAGEGRPTP